MKKWIIALIFLVFPVITGMQLLGSGIHSGVDTTPPTLSSATIGTDGETWTLAFNENVTIGAGGSGGWAVTMSVAGSVGLTYSSGDGTSSLVYTGDTVVNSGETVSSGLDYTQPGDGIEDTSGNDLANISSHAVTNNSTQGGGYATPTRVDFDSLYTGTFSADVSVSASSGDTVILITTGTPTQNVTGVGTNNGSGTCGSWTQIINSTTGVSAEIAVWYASVTGTGTIDVRPTGTASDSGYTLVSYSGIDPATQADATNASINGGTTFACDAIAVGLSGSLGIAVWASEDADSTVVWHDGGTAPDFSMFVNDSSHIQKIADKVTTSADNYGWTPTWSGSNKADGVVIYIAPAAL
jgi:hypothetical protein